MNLLPDHKDTYKVRDDLLQMQQWASQFTKNDPRIEKLITHLSLVRQDLEKLL